MMILMLLLTIYVTMGQPVGNNLQDEGGPELIRRIRCAAGAGYGRFKGQC